MYIYPYIINIHRTHTYIMQTKLLFWMWLIAINNLTALIYAYADLCQVSYNVIDYLMSFNFMEIVLVIFSYIYIRENN